MDNYRHEPVLLAEVLEWLAPVAGSRLLDCTFGGGGYTRAFLDAGAREVVGLDRDPAAVQRGQRLAAGDPRFHMVETRFGDLAAAVEGTFDGIVFDIGVSSFQLDDPDRGFSFRADGPLDMRMGDEGPTAADLLNGIEEAELARLLRRYGEEPQARRVARAIARRRIEQPFTRTLDLADVVRATLGRPTGRGIDPATRTFQALRIAVNDELGELERGLADAIGHLAPGGRMVVVSFHSLEDRIVKTVFREASGRSEGVSRHQPVPSSARAAPLELLTRKIVRPSDEEASRNPRARSARLRAARRREAPI